MARMTVYRLQPSGPKHNMHNNTMSKHQSQQVILLPGGGQMVDVSNLRQHMDGFIKQWNLNRVSQELLTPLPMEAQVDIIMNFCPRDASRDVNPVFQSFAKSRALSMGVNVCDLDSLAPAQLVAQQAKAPAEIIAFCNTWELSDRSSSYLASLPPEVQTDIISDFQPRDLSRDVNNVFLAFASSRYRNATLRMMNGSRPTRSTLIEFGRKWGLNCHSMELLQSLGQVVQEKILAGFNPHDTSRDVNNVFGSFARSRAVMTFIDSWRLTEESAKQLKALDHHLQIDIMTNFSPHHMTRDINPLFMSFLRSRELHENGGKTSHRAVGNKSDFAQRWNLKQENLVLLQSLPEDVSADVVRNFRPRDSARDVNAIFASFCRSRVASHKPEESEEQACDESKP